MIELISVNLEERSYPIYISSEILNDIGKTLKDLKFEGRVLVVTNPTINVIYGNRTIDSLKKSGYNAEIFEIPDGEKFKTLETVSSIYDFLIERFYDRQTIMIALGGGVVGDITGFAAATFLRGVRFVQIPTSLVAMVDSSVGGKTGVNHKLGKNLIGSFHQPSFVYIDTSLLKTLEKREFIGGMAEVIKYGVIRDMHFFDYLSDNYKKIMDLAPEHITHIVKTSCSIKADVVEKDEREGGLRAILNFGHTIGHAIESLTGYTKYTHGEGVAIGMMAAAQIAKEMNLLGSTAVQRIWDILSTYKLPYKIPDNIAPESIIEKLKSDKKAEGGTVKFIIPNKIGHVEIRKDVEKEIILKALKGII